MQKKLLCLVLLVLLPVKLSAAGLTLTFSGVVSDFRSDSSEDVARSFGFHLGDRSEFQILVDADSAPYRVEADGDVTLLDPNPFVGWTRGYAELVAGRLLPLTYTGVDHRYFEEKLNQGPQGRFDYFNVFVGDGLQISTAGPTEYANLHDLVGAKFIAQQTFRYGNTQRGWMQFDLALTQVTAVPVPAAAWLFGSGLVGFLGLSLRRDSALVGNPRLPDHPVYLRVLGSGGRGDRPGGHQ